MVERPASVQAAFEVFEDKNDTGPHATAMFAYIRDLERALAERAGGVRECATEGCENAASVRIERGGVGSDYCGPCYLRVQAIPHAQPLTTEPAAPEGCRCQDCGKAYRTDLLVSADVWEKIKPEGKPVGGGLLCPTCIMDRASDLGIWTVAYAAAPEGQQPVAWWVHDLHIARQPVKAKSRFPEATEYLYPASREEHAREAARTLGAACTPLYTRPAEQAVTYEMVEAAQSAIAMYIPPKDMRRVLEAALARKEGKP